ncbi:MAG: 8-oxo-dGTP diphosphatase MutT [Gammaproteobacteria bacterium]|nr:8-oxo-dGTP diphosphatase MutT [Gammaproteobacteria bacterium]
MRVVAAVIKKEDKILIARRKEGKHLEFKWEFPGGKVEEGEKEEITIERELLEEFNVKVKVHQFITESFYDYGHIKVKLMAYLVEHIDGVFNPTDHDKIEWIKIEDQKQYDFAPADIPINDYLLAHGI